MRFTNVVVFGAALPPLASAANFVRGYRVSFNTFKYDIDKCTDEKPCSLYLAGTEFIARIQNVPSGTYIFQATGGEDGKTAITTQFTHSDNALANDVFCHGIFSRDVSRDDFLSSRVHCGFVRFWFYSAGNEGAVVDENCNGAIDNNDCAELGGSCYV
ncbi:phosphoinositide 3-kinase [Metarhizium guizhouense ARSEF 977]|uniref:Phosphoinositide 3-kinase n=1 Tax=Metarhizium guizhouense (strain ARSEF 977) TaxID=1276136 RepID=A0A0B4HI65_METGA|nr:phosphoinositide 3-kinase [Metarhizium guizhouense ARSEF 977]